MKPKQPPGESIQKLADQTDPAPRFDGEQAYGYLTAQTDFGPRNPGSEGHRKCLAFLQREMQTFAESVSLQEFSYTDVKGESFSRLANVVAKFNAKSPVRILLTAHWDTRPWADNDPDPSNRTKPILGANDGASGIAVLLEIGRQLKANPPPIGVDIVFFDCEDMGQRGSLEHWCIGSKHFAKNRPQAYTPRFAVNLDMVGDRMLSISREKHSDKYAPEAMNLIFGTAHELGLSQFVNEPGDETYDDHIPLNESGIPAVDLIDFNYPDNSNRYWHSLEDTPDKCSSESLAAVGGVLLQMIYVKHLNF